MMRPGGMQFTVMPCLPTSRDRPFAQECIAALAQKAPLMPSGSDLPVRLTMRPHLRAIIWSTRRSASWRWRVKLSVMASCHCASSVCRENLREPPALLTRMSTVPRPASAASAMRCGASSAIRSCSMITSFAPISFSSVSSRSRRRATAARRTPSAASALAMARPMPTLAPVTRAVFPESCRSMAAFSGRTIDLRSAGIKPIIACIA